MDKYKDFVNNLEHEVRRLEFFLMKNMFENEEENILKELLNFQNSDGGFGHGLEPDIRMPESSVACSDVAIAVLEEIKDESLKKEVIEALVAYYERVYNKESNAWEIVPQEVDSHPRAVWWNYENVDTFTYGNPNPEVIGFLYKYKDLLKTINIDEEIQRVVNYVNTKFLEEKSQHSIVSMLHFYRDMPDNIKELIKENLKEAVFGEMLTKKFNKYGLEPYTVYMHVPEFLEGMEDVLKNNLLYQEKKLKKGIITPNWEWYQYEVEFENIKYEWSGLLTFNVLKAIIKSASK